MRKIGFIALVIVLFGCSQTPEVSKLEKQHILEVSDSVMEASKDEDVEKIMSFFLEEMIIEINKPNEKAYSYDYESYKSHLLSVFGMISSYDYERKYEVVSKKRDGSLQLEFKLNESYVFRGEARSEAHREKIIFVKDGVSYKVKSIVIN